MLEFGDLSNWLENWIASASKEELQSKFQEVIPYLDDQDIAYLFYSEVCEKFPVKEIDALIQ